MRYHLRHEDMTPGERAVRFRYFTPEQLEAAIRWWGLPDVCDDPDVLRSAAAAEVADEQRRARQEAARR